eukprot:CAMPEP_0197234716 /NCGR_PEP_ID=MMETSP1429-20130617/2398_1 /TAXON_ID=49237 /ORGANISM="Chaetoceros  sp., Strain UNC1202" /LENGTH=52 /DNA_ID=CAMNT_0042693193 /DNA_START=295 /DNA_END=453 /DNA_ORIENTATION=-
MAMWMRATPQRKAVVVVAKRHMMTPRMKGMRRMPPPGERIWDIMDILGCGID